jgi:L-ascorbate metabolism protein UlaG (beta-lactamase superfamily)
MQDSTAEPSSGQGATAHLTWIGHSTVVLDLDGVRLLTDPLLRARLGHLRRHGAPPAPAVTDRIDAVLVSHVHLDHLDVRSLRRLDRETRVIAPVGAGDLVRRIGFDRVDEVAPGDRLEVRDAVVAAVPAVHDGRRRPRGIVAATLGFEVAGVSRTYFAGDTALFDGMRALAGRIDVALLPIWGWGPSLGPGHLDPAGAAQAAALVRPRIAVPIHWGTFFPAGLGRLRGRALVDPPREFARRVAALAPVVDVRVLAPGETLALEKVAA